MSMEPNYGPLHERASFRQAVPSRFLFDPKHSVLDSSVKEASSFSSAFIEVRDIEEGDDNGTSTMMMAGSRRSNAASRTVRVAAAMQTSADGYPGATVLPPSHGNSNLSEGTEHILIAAGSIGATIFLVLAIYAIYSMRKRNLSFQDLLRAKTWTDRSLDNDSIKFTQHGYQYEIEGAYSKSLPVSPPESVLSHPSNASIRPLVNPRGVCTYQSSHRDSERSRLREEREEIRDDVHPLPTQIPLARTADHRHTRTSSDGSDTYIIQSQEEPAPDFGRSPQTFKQFIANRRISAAPLKSSHFSWNTSQAAQTPKDHDFNRMSGSTFRSTGPRFKTVESWVNSQSNRVEAQRLQQNLAERQEERDRPHVPDVPKQYRGPTHTRDLSRQTTKSDATVFRHHPGTEVQIPRASLVPSEILDSKTRPPSL
ncbi:hypothetical protein EJ05DRAFT_6180 [Pseudovirgaria hyperparasitica]|uniref:Uncharacterized protein n=1 Tax=Pseudovirgaria hyperparasitica TaxID=470096 RepID=A0A6A6WK78_9PEZI|nr:uncharacterized protein EJ05DRAFT_6180 [Pseudovirgaria hyperparasitica]KAF2762565.1 hypothetical protein EJ05DRAFT_6180 [Pseudovirgaria hyperparasitica]